jgi:nitrite reductase (NADH) small subunit
VNKLTKLLATKKAKLIPRIGRLIDLQGERIALFQLSDGRV